MAVSPGSNERLAVILARKLRAAAALLDRCDVDLRRRCDRDSVHAMRIATRRARALLWSMKPWAKRDRYRVAAGHLKTIGSQVAPLRDMDVLAHLLLSRIASEARLVKDERQQLRQDVRRHRARVRREVIAAIRSTGYRHALRATRELLAAGPAMLRQPVPAGATCWRKRIQRGLDRFERQAHQAHHKDLHQIRILARRCRYALEAQGQGAPRKTLLHLRELQTLLGRYCDARLSTTWLKSQHRVRDPVLRARLLQAAQILKSRHAKSACRALRTQG